MLQSTSRELAAKALAAAMKIEYVHRGGMPPSDVPGIPDQEWQPATYGEFADALKVYLKLLRPLLKDDDAGVRTSAIEALYTAVPGVFKFAESLFDFWLEEVETFVGGDYSEREVVLRSIRSLSERFRAELQRSNPDFETSPARLMERLQYVQECLERLIVTEEKLLGSEFSSRFRWVLFQTNQYAGLQPDKESEKEAANELEMLTKKAIESPELLNEEWEWLFEQKEWGRVVRLDRVTWQVGYAAGVREYSSGESRNFTGRAAIFVRLLYYL